MREGEGPFFSKDPTLVFALLAGNGNRMDSESNRTSFHVCPKTIFPHIQNLPRMSNDLKRLNFVSTAAAASYLEAEKLYKVAKAYVPSLVAPTVQRTEDYAAGTLAPLVASVQDLGGKLLQYADQKVTASRGLSSEQSENPEASGAAGPFLVTTSAE